MQRLLRDNPESERDTSRLEAFSDGVIAIAITLLVLEIRVPHIENATTDALWQALRDLWPNYLGYVISFATIGIMWANHHLIFRYIACVDHYLILTNPLFLFFVAAIPFPTALMADYLGLAAEQVGVIVYSGWFLLTALSYNLLWHYASSGNRLIDPDADQAAVRDHLAFPAWPAGVRIGVSALVLQPGGEPGRAARVGPGVCFAIPRASSMKHPAHSSASPYWLLAGEVGVAMASTRCTCTTNVRLAAPTAPVTCQQPGVGKIRPVG